MLDDMSDRGAEGAEAERLADDEGAYRHGKDQIERQHDWDDALHLDGLLLTQSDDALRAPGQHPGDNYAIAAIPAFLIVAAFVAASMQYWP